MRFDSEAEQKAFLDAACANDPGLRRRIEELLAASSNFSGQFGLGTLIRVTPDGTLTELKSFDGNNGDTGWFNSNPLLQGADGNLYGATVWGGRSGGYGTIFKATTAGELNTLVEFTGTNGAYPAALVHGADGNLYGARFRSPVGVPTRCKRVGGTPTAAVETTALPIELTASLRLSEGRTPTAAGSTRQEMLRVCQFTSSTRIRAEAMSRQLDEAIIN